MLLFTRNTRFSDETLTFLRLKGQSDAVQMNEVEVSTMRQNMEDMHEKFNESLRGSFKGTIQEETVKLNSTG